MCYDVPGVSRFTATTSSVSRIVGGDGPGVMISNGDGKYPNSRGSLLALLLMVRSKRLRSPSSVIKVEVYTVVSVFRVPNRSALNDGRTVAINARLSRSVPEMTSIAAIMRGLYSPITITTNDSTDSTKLSVHIHSVTFFCVATNVSTYCV